MGGTAGGCPSRSCSFPDPTGPFLHSGSVHGCPGHCRYSGWGAAPLALGRRDVWIGVGLQGLCCVGMGGPPCHGCSRGLSDAEHPSRGESGAGLCVYIVARSGAWVSLGYVDARQLLAGCLGAGGACRRQVHCALHSAVLWDIASALSTLADGTVGTGTWCDRGWPRGCSHRTVSASVKKA